MSLKPLMLWLAEIPARRTARPVKVLPARRRRSAIILSDSCLACIRVLWFERIRRQSVQMPLGLGGDLEPTLSNLVTLCSPPDSGPVALALTIDGTGCSCSPSLPTPCARDHKGRSSKSWRERSPSEARKSEKRPYATLPDAIGGCPHPEYVERLMGFPTGYTDLGHSEIL